MSELNIGGPFHLQLNSPITSTSRQVLTCLNNEFVGIYASARSALKSILLPTISKNINIRRIFIPAYTCPSFIDSIAGFNLQVEYRDCHTQATKYKKVEVIQYHHFPTDWSQWSTEKFCKVAGLRPVEQITASLEALNFLDTLDEHDVVIFNDYFGFRDPVFLSVVTYCKALKVHDCSQNLFDDYPFRNSIQLFSPRKFIGVPDGGIAVLHGKTQSMELRPTDNRHQHRSSNVDFMNASLHYLAGQCYNPNTRLRFFQEAEDLIDEEAYDPASELSTGILVSMSAGDVSVIKSRRRENYLTLPSELRDHCLYDHLPHNVVPMGFPVLVEDAKIMQRRLADRGLFCPRHWVFMKEPVFGALMVDNKIMETRDLLSKHLLTIPCDQRYGWIEMNRAISVFQEELQKEKL